MELVKIKFKGGWALAEPQDVANGKYEPYVEPAIIEYEHVDIQEEDAKAEVEAEDVESKQPPVEVKEDAPNNRGRKRSK